MSGTSSGSASASTASPRRGRPGSTATRSAASAREAIERAFAGDDPGGEPERDEYARVREQVVTSLVAEVAEAAGETPFEFIELSGAVKGYADGRPTGDPSPTIAWQLGVDVRRGRGAPATGSRRSATRPTRSGSRATSTRTARPRSPSSSGPSIPDCDSAEDLRAKVELARERGLGRVDFYHYGLMRLDALDLVREALDESVAQRSTSRWPRGRRAGRPQSRE